MYSYFEDFSSKNEKNRPYFVENEKNARFNHEFGYVENDTYFIHCSGGRSILRTPDLKSFKLEYDFKFMKPIVDRIVWGAYFGYNKIERTGHLVLIDYNEQTKQATVSLYSVCSEERSLIEERTFESAVYNTDDTYLFSLEVNDGTLRVKFDGIEAEFKGEFQKGQIALTKDHSSTGLAISSIKIESDDEVTKRELFSKTVTVPNYDGTVAEHKINISVCEYENGIKEITTSLSGGVEFTKPWDRMRCWVSIIEWYKNPYIRFIGDCYEGKLFLKTGKLSFIDSVNKQSGTIRKLAGSLYPATENEPFVRKFQTEFFNSVKYVVFGYDYSKTLIFDNMGDRSEFVFDTDGQLAYYGKPLSDEAIVKVASPFKSFFEEKVKASAFTDKESALYHVRNNHYFMDTEEAKFEIKCLYRTPCEFFEVKVCLQNAVFKKISELEICDIKERVNDFGQNEITFTVNAGKLPSAVYHVAVECFNGSRRTHTHTSAFSVYDSKSDKSPIELSGLPFIHIGDFILCDPTPWSLKPDYNMAHYVDSIVSHPQKVEELKTWELTHLYRKKTCTWMTQRTIGKRDFREFSECIKHTDYLYLGFPGIEASGNYYRYDHFHRSLFVAQVIKDAYTKFREMHPEYNLALLKEDELISFDDFARLGCCFDEWCDYVNEIVEELFNEQWAEVKKINPNIKRYSYGPYNLYATDDVGAEVIKYFGYKPETIAKRFDGFVQFEDYTFCCDYPRARSSWGMATGKLLAKGLRISPELYDSFEPGCPDGHVSFATPPFSETFAEPYQTVAQLYAYLYNSVYFTNGSFNYWSDKTFMMYNPYSLEPQKRYHTLMEGWGRYLENKPKNPKRTVAYLYKTSDKDNRFEFQNEGTARSVFYNRCATNMYNVYEHLSALGVPPGFLTDTLESLSANEIDTLVIPSTYALSKEDINAVKALHASGVKLIATGSVAGLEDLFGVKERPQKLHVNMLYRGNRSENITPFDTEITYTSNGAEALILSNGNSEMIFRYKNTALINCDLAEVGAERFAKQGGQGARTNVSVIMKDALEALLLELVTPLVKASAGCYANLFECENGYDEILLHDYTNFEHSDDNRVTVMISSDEYKDVEAIDEALEINRLIKDGALRGFEVTLRARQSQLLRLIKKG